MDVTAPASSLDIGEALLARQKISQEQLNMARQDSASSGKTVDQVLVDRGFVTGSDITTLRAELIGIAYSDISKKPISPEVIALVPQAVANPNSCNARISTCVS